MQQQPGFNQPGIPPAGPPGRPARRPTPWWAWMIGGCAGCAMVLLIAITALGFWGVNQLSNIASGIGPVTEARVRQDLGGDVPIYPNSTFDPNSTGGALVGLKIAEKAGGDKIRGMFRALGGFQTADSADQVFQFYNQKLKPLGWKVVREKNSGTQKQRVYQKGNDYLVVSVQPGEAENTLILMRGGKGLLEQSVPPKTQIVPRSAPKAQPN